jgi:D-3-phosphoglycerate dehydrogenase
MGKILITPRSLTRDGHPALEKLCEVGHQLVFCRAGVQPDEEELLSLVPGCLAYLAGVEKIGARVLEAARQLVVISRNGIGIENIDLEAAKRLNIRIETTPGANARGVAELTIGLLFALIRSIPNNDRNLKSGQWQRRRGIEVEGRTIGVVGCGNIGKTVSQLALCLGMDVLAYDVYPDRSFAPGERFRYTALGELLHQADFVTLHCPPPEKGEPVINRNRLKVMKKGVFLINTARAGLVEEQALFEAIETGRVAGYATDVFETEPPRLNPLLQHDRVLITPHQGGYTEESMSRAVHGAVDNILHVLNKESSKAKKRSVDEHGS